MESILFTLSRSHNISDVWSRLEESFVVYKNQQVIRNGLDEERLPELSDTSTQSKDMATIPTTQEELSDDKDDEAIVCLGKNKFCWQPHITIAKLKQYKIHFHHFVPWSLGLNGHYTIYRGFHHQYLIHTCHC